MCVIPDTYKYRSIDVAKYIVATANDKRVVINMTKLQKLLYVVYGSYLRVHKCRLTDEHPKAWPYGPVFPRVREQLLLVDFSTLTDEAGIGQDEDVAKIVSEAIDTFGKFNAMQLSGWSHQDGSPWYITTESKGFNWDDEINDMLIYDYFGGIINEQVTANEQA